MLGLSGHVSDVPSALLATLVVVMAGVIYLSANVVIHSLAFWLAEMQQTARTFADYLIMFSMYPQTIYGGSLKALVFTLIPAGFIGWLPVETLREPTLLHISELVLAGGGSLGRGIVADLLQRSTPRLVRVPIWRASLDAYGGILRLLVSR